MDTWNQKPKKNRFLSFVIWLVVFIGIVLGVSAFLAYNSVPSIANVNDCFTTSMFQVELCPKKAGYVRFNQLPKHLTASLIASEDATFYFHKGFDWDEIKDSLEKSLDAGRWVRGGSTITQQLAKNLYLTKEKSLTRKLKEFFISQQLEQKLTKPQIIEKYFNVVEFAKGVYGIQKGAYHYFQKSPGELTPAESAYLVSLLPNPIKYSSAFHARKELSNYNKRRVTRLLSLLKRQGTIGESEYNYEVARAEAGLWTPLIPDNLFAPTEDADTGDDLNEEPTEQENSEMESLPAADEVPALDGDYSN